MAQGAPASHPMPLRVAPLSRLLLQDYNLRASPFDTLAGSHDVGMLYAKPLDGASQLKHLPLITLYLTERCNSRRGTCDYWRHGRADTNLESVTRLLPSLGRLQTKVILVST
jgi:hypothetical protein